MFCSHCGSRVEERDLFCGRCGMPLTAPNIIHPLIVSGCVVTGLGIYLWKYKPAISLSVSIGGTTTWLHLHVISYLLSYSLFLAALLLAVVTSINRRIVPRFHWVEIAMCAATGFNVLAILSGAMFARPVWGIYITLDAKITLALLNGLLAVFIVTPLVFWLGHWSNSERRFTLIVLTLVLPIFFFPQHSAVVA